ncbi:hypothetical protein A8B79_08535 [Balneola sp. EhC07]|uniref:transposase n=1 Tax=Balneola sp. EhC07 TaxID=1849360 RepID=UPI0007F3D0AE|nr:transposase [Balneola sp. EhC07]OAN61492.1 hypothetical protein A8B79_08535 [Balneola sp. EhC07]
MEFLAGHNYHIYNQGNNREPIFFEEDDYILFLKKMKITLLPHCKVLAWCLMPNHFHWLININSNYKEIYESNTRSKKLNAINKDIGSLLSSYTQDINRRIGRTGSLFRKRTKAKLMDEERDKHDDYLLNCFLYIHQNPLRAGLVKNLEDWAYSSYRDYGGLRNGNLCDIGFTKELLHLPKSQKDFEKLSYKTIPPYYSQKMF